MDFLDPKKRRRHGIILAVSYAVAVVIVLGVTILLLYSAYGWGLGKNGEIIQNGLVFVSSHPSGADIYLNGTRKGTSGARLNIQSGDYTISLQKDGYRPWQKGLKVGGGTVQHMVYPFLFPTQLITAVTKTFDQTPALETQSPDHHWLLMQPTAGSATIQQYDVSSPTAAAAPPVVLTIPTTALSAPTSTQHLAVVSWADDNRHVLLTDAAGGKTDYILLDRTNPAASVNLTRAFTLTASQELTLQNSKYNQYYIYDRQTHTLAQDVLGQTVATALLSNVLAYKTFGSDTVLYVTTAGQSAGKAAAVLRQSGQDYPLRKFALKGPYELGVSQYDGDWFAAVGAASEGHVYLYKDPASQYANSPTHAEVPLSILNVADTSVVSFSPTSQFVMAEHGTQFAVYDMENDVRYAFTLAQPLDKPQTVATWMDGSHLEYVSKGKLVVADFDGTNLQALMAALPQYAPAYDPTYRYVYALAPAVNAKQTALTNTALLIPADL